MRDRASINSVAMRTVSILYKQMLDIGCISHTLDLEGKHMMTTVFNDLVKSWIGLFSHSPKSRLLWMTLTGLSPPSYSATRWWSRFEVIQQLLKVFEDVVAFLSSRGLPPATSTKLLEILRDPPK